MNDDTKSLYEAHFRKSSDEEYTMLPKSLRKLTLASVSSSGDDKSKSDAKSVSKTLPPKVSSSYSSLLSEMGCSQTDVTQLLRSELLQERSKGRHEGSLADYKHFYNPCIALTTPTTTEATYAICRIAGGTATNTRTGATIGLKRVRIKIAVVRIDAGNTGQDYAPTLSVCLWRDKIVTTPGAVPTIFGTDANPPASGTLIFTQVGASTNEALAMPFRNPITEDAYHVYKFDQHQLALENGYNWFYDTGAAGVRFRSAPRTWHFYIDQDLHDVQQKYATYATANPDINDLNLTFRVNVNATNMSYLDKYTFCSDVEFYDIQV